jgi:hypothetical protein
LWLIPDPKLTLHLKIIKRALSSHAPTRRSLQKSKLDQVRLVDFFDRLRLFADRRANSIQPHRPAAVILQHRQHDLWSISSSPKRSTSSRSSAVSAVWRHAAVGSHLRVIRTRRSKRLAMRGVPLRRAISPAPSSSISTLSSRAERLTICFSSSAVMVQAQH